MHVAACEKAIDPDVSENKMAKSTSKQEGTDEETLKGAREERREDREGRG